MYPKKNLDVIKKIQHASFQGKTPIDCKELYIEQSVFDVDLDTPIFRIMELDHLIADLKSEKLTHVKACKETWGDDYENPLLQVSFTEEETGEKLTLSGIVDDFYGLSWTLDKNESLDAWQSFSYGKPSVRIKSTPRQLLERLMNDSDEFFMLHHYIGEVKYHSKKEIVNYFTQTHYTQHLDSLGQGAALSLMALRNVFSVEKEIRVLYSYQPDSCNWVKNNISLNGYLCEVPFEWKGAIDEIMFSPMTKDKDKSLLKNTIQKQSVNCTVLNSNL